jgi:hypothetical protein
MAVLKLITVRAEALSAGVVYAVEKTTPAAHVELITEHGIDLVAIMKEQVTTDLIHDARRNGVVVPWSEVTVTAVEHELDLGDE